jgi:hypothetical protein
MRGIALVVDVASARVARMAYLSMMHVMMPAAPEGLEGEGGGIAKEA